MKTAHAHSKALTARRVAQDWQKGDLIFAFDTHPPTRPSRPDRPTLLDPGKMPRRRKGHSQTHKIALLHAVAHIELNAIDLAFDIIARFGEHMPRAFCDDWIKVGDDEAKHFLLLEGLLTKMDSYYGQLPAHDGLWQSAEETSHDLPARLAIVPMILEARGLDVTPIMIERFTSTGDHNIAEALQIIYFDEITHVEKGTKWFDYLAKKNNKDPEKWFHDLVQIYFKGLLKKPFNDEARTQAGLFPSFYEPLTEMLEIQLQKRRSKADKL